ncbi:MAG: MFS transporter [Streptosporangiales bacterium]|nr:MFS transporter [Streptosporangiales bacterium]MBO0891706.1 MFS transporter [Acidothermales bacterium]
MRGSWAGVARIVLVAANLRAAIAALAPVLPQVRDDLGLTRGTAGLLTTVPVLCFGLLAPAAGMLGRRFGSDRVLFAGLLAIAVGVAVRSQGTAYAAFAGTVVLGLGITVGNVVVPPVVKRDFPAHTGAVTSAYTASLTGGAAVAAAATAPLALSAGLGWRIGLLVWALPALVAAAVWLPRRRALPAPELVEETAQVPHGRVWRSGVAWAIAAFMATQSLLFYAMTAWLPALLQDGGVGAEPAGIALSEFSLVGIAGSLAVPFVGRRVPHRVLGVAVAGLWCVSLVGLLTARGAYPVWTTVSGLAQGAGIALALTFVVDRAGSARTAHSLSGMVQGVGYVFAATGPFVLGSLRDAAGSWSAPLWALLAVTLCLSVFAVLTGRPPERARR